MVPTQVTIFSIIMYVLESLVIIVQSCTTVAVLFREWMHFQRLSPVEIILISLGISHFCLQWTSMLYNFGTYSRPVLLFWKVSVVWEFMNILTFWLTSLLAVLYCVKVSSFTHPVFLWLRLKILKLVLWLILGALIASCLSIIPSVVKYHIQMELVTLDHLPKNSSLILRLQMFEWYFSNPFKMIGFAVPFLVFLISIILLTVSLVQHWGQMKHYSSSSSSLKAQCTVLKSLATFFFFFTSYFLTIVVSFIGTVFDKKSWFWVCEAVIYGLVCIHFTSLMMSNPTLKKALRLQFGSPESS
ncbi:taste receptor type 2 member 16 [Rattus rattus]|uniref:taste receptor type 2 member 16 n=1 Tax=Rattus rattus TaxID=10117 RepID=UPI0013F35AD7|nr:taste receptor type 2 member 16 [Rattus rattus]